MFSRRVFGGAGDTFRLVLEYGSPSFHEVDAAAVRLPRALATLNFEWNSQEAESSVAERFVLKQSSLLVVSAEEHINVFITPSSTAKDATIKLSFSTAMSMPEVRCLQLARGSSSGVASESLLKALFKHVEQTSLWKIKGAEGFGNFWSTSMQVAQLSSLRNLNLSYCGLAVLPSEVGQLQSLRILRVSHNKLTALPVEIGKLTLLEVLAADNNQLTSVPVDVRQCRSLKELNLEANRIAAPLLDLRAMNNSLQSLQLYGNPLEYLPELSPCSQLRFLSLANVRIMADSSYTRWEVEVGPLPYMARAHKLTPLFRLTFRRASLQHPLLAGALGRIAEDKTNCELIAKEEVALQQLVLMALSENSVVVQQACKTLGHLAVCDSATVRKLLGQDVLSAMNTLVLSNNQDNLLCGLHVLSSLAGNSDDVSEEVLTDTLLKRLYQLIQEGNPTVRQAALWCLSSLCFSHANRRAIRAMPGLLPCIAEMARLHTNPASLAAHIASYSEPYLPDCLRPESEIAKSPSTSPAVTAGGGQGTTTASSKSASGSRNQSVGGSGTTPGVAGTGTAGVAGGGGVAASHHSFTSTYNIHNQQHGSAPSSPRTPRSPRRPDQHPNFWQIHFRGSDCVSEQTRLSALRVLAVLGEHDAVRAAMHEPAVTGRGVRVLSLDGGGMKGIALVQILRALQERLPLPIYQYFDLIVGTSTGAIVAVCIGLLNMNLDGVEAVYTQLGKKVFNAARVAEGDEGSATWRDSLYRVYRNSSQHMRVAVYGSKHDPAPFEELLRQVADMEKLGCLTNQMIDATSLPSRPKVALVSTCTTRVPAEPYLFRTYELPAAMDAQAAAMCASNGNSRIQMWQAVRASAAAPYYLEDFAWGEERFQDGATTANNPGVIALQQARLLWPNLHVDALVSLGCGAAPIKPREKGMSAMLDMGQILVECACSTDRVHESLATTLPMTLPKTHYFRFQPVDDRFAVDLDDVSPASIAKLQAAAKDYCTAHTALLDTVTGLLMKQGTLPGSTADMDHAMHAAGGVPGQHADEAVLESGDMDVDSVAVPGHIRMKKKRGLLVLCAQDEDQTPVPVQPPALALQRQIVDKLSTLPQTLRTVNLMMGAKRQKTDAGLRHSESPVSAFGNHHQQDLNKDGVLNSVLSNGSVKAEATFSQHPILHPLTTSRAAHNRSDSRVTIDTFVRATNHSSIQQQLQNGMLADRQDASRGLPIDMFRQPSFTFLETHGEGRDEMLPEGDEAGQGRGVATPSLVTHPIDIPQPDAAAGVQDSTKSVVSDAAEGSSAGVSVSTSILNYFLPRWSSSTPIATAPPGAPPATTTSSSNITTGNTTSAQQVGAALAAPEELQHKQSTQQGLNDTLPALIPSSSPKITDAKATNKSSAFGNAQDLLGPIDIGVASDSAEDPFKTLSITVTPPDVQGMTMKHDKSVHNLQDSVVRESGDSCQTTTLVDSTVRKEQTKVDGTPPQQQQGDSFSDTLAAVNSSLTSLMRFSWMGTTHPASTPTAAAVGAPATLLQGAQSLPSKSPRTDRTAATKIPPLTLAGDATALGPRSADAVLPGNSRSAPTSSGGSVRDAAGEALQAMGRDGAGFHGVTALRPKSSGGAESGFVPMISVPSLQDGMATHNDRPAESSPTFAPYSEGTKNQAQVLDAHGIQSRPHIVLSSPPKRRLRQVQSMAHPELHERFSVSAPAGLRGNSAFLSIPSSHHASLLQGSPNTDTPSADHRRGVGVLQSEDSGLVFASDHASDASPMSSKLLSPWQSEHADSTVMTTHGFDGSVADVDLGLGTSPRAYSGDGHHHGSAFASNPAEQHSTHSIHANAPIGGRVLQHEQETSGLHREDEAMMTSGPSPCSMLTAVLQDLASDLGIVHLALQADLDRQALVTQWTSEVRAVVEPGPEATTLVRRLTGHHSMMLDGHLYGQPPSSLAALTATNPNFSIGSEHYTRLSMQEVLLGPGNTVRSMLFSVAKPCAWLLPEDVTAAAVHWAACRLVTASAVLPTSIVQALLRAGVPAVVCLCQQPSPWQAQYLPDMFAQLYKALHNGEELHRAMEVSEASLSLHDVLVCYTTG